jgi:hypothetical protein
MLTVTLTDSSLSTIKTTFQHFVITLFNPQLIKVNSGAPYFTEDLLTSVSVELGKSVDIVFPKIADPDNDIYTVTLNGLSRIGSFGFYTEGQGIRLRPTSSQEVGIYTIGVVLKDASKSTKYTISIEVKQ